jgi:hypothetical protein
MAQFWLKRLPAGMSKPLKDLTNLETSYKSQQQEKGDRND